MKILEKDISSQSKQFIDYYSPLLNKPILNKHLPEGFYGYGGLANCSNHYEIVASTDLPQKAFEANYCHEFYHAVQISQGFPNVLCKQHSPPKEIEIFGMDFRSTILDMDVNDHLGKFDIDFSFFNNQRYKIIKDLCNRNFGLVKDQFHADILTLNLTLLFSQIPNTKANLIKSKLDSLLPNISIAICEIQKLICQFGYTEPEGCFHIFGNMLTLFEMWKYYYIEYKGIKFKTVKNFNDYLSSYGR